MRLPRSIDWPIERIRVDEVQPDDDWDFRISYPGVAHEENAIRRGLANLPVVRQVYSRRTDEKRFEIVAGHTTFLALQNLRRGDFYARVLGPEVGRLERRLLNVEHNLKDPHLTSYERAQAIFLLSHELTPHEIGALFPQLSPNVINLSIRARMELPVPITDAWRDNRIGWRQIDRMMHIAADRRLEHWMSKGPDSSPPPTDDEAADEEEPEGARELAKMPEIVGRLHGHLTRILEHNESGPFERHELRAWITLLEMLLRLRPWPEDFPDPRPRSGRPAGRRGSERPPREPA